MKRNLPVRLAAIDVETDPFLAGRVPKPFAAGFYSDGRYADFWGDSCISELMHFLRAQEENYLIYCHNGGKFDFFYMLPYMTEEVPLIINGRIVEWHMRGADHVFRDSLTIIPVPLAEIGSKDDIDYRLFERQRRERHKKKILSYLRQDCATLFDVVSRFCERFGEDPAKPGKRAIPISIGQASMREIKHLHSFSIATEASDEDMRQYYFGGRVQCFASGIIEGPWSIYDVNSMYPYAMVAYDHPVSDVWEELEHPPRTNGTLWFARFIGRNINALPLRIAEGARKGAIEFDVPQGEFFACSHELVWARQAGLVKVDKWLEIYKPRQVGRFDTFVDKFSREKIERKLAGDKAGEKFAKLIMNSGYGKFGQNPRDFRDYQLLFDPFHDKRIRTAGFEPESILSEDPFVQVWSRPAAFQGRGFYNVGIAASITSAARSMLLEGLQHAEDPIYCDTDSVICRSFSGRKSATELGAWKYEGTAFYAAIAGRKTYCVYDLDGRGKPIPVKWASKGGDLTPEQIIDIAVAGEVEATNEVPTYSLHSGVGFIKRRFRNTIDRITPFPVKSA